jgi:hypothetical protein
VIYNLQMKAAAETTLAIAADPKRLGARIGITAVLHSWGLGAHPSRRQQISIWCTNGRLAEDQDIQAPRRPSSSASQLPAGRDRSLEP